MIPDDFDGDIPVNVTLYGVNFNQLHNELYIALGLIAEKKNPDDFVVFNEVKKHLEDAVPSIQKSSREGGFSYNVQVFFDSPDVSMEWVCSACGARGEVEYRETDLSAYDIWQLCTEKHQEMIDDGRECPAPVGTSIKFGKVRRK